VRVAVTGASGFVGRHILVELQHRHVEIFAVTRNGAKLQSAPAGVHVVEMDIALPGAEYLTRIGNPDVLIHLAWDGLPNYRSLHHVESELPKHYNFLKGLIEAGLPSLFIAGTCLEYGMQSGALSEEAEPCPGNPYGFAKAALHRKLKCLKAVHPFNLIWGRLFYMYGVGQSGCSLFSMLRDAVARGDRVFDMSGGEQVRDYLPVQEVARVIVQLALSGADLGTVNICSGKPVSVRNLVKGWLTENGWEIQLNLGHFPYPDYEPMTFWGDDTKLQKILRINQ
jgi:dTDP-6-deoxy-L-talose 4-dehydrogenase (NAD+)